MEAGDRCVNSGSGSCHYRVLLSKGFQIDYVQVSEPILQNALLIIQSCVILDKTHLPSILDCVVLCKAMKAFQAGDVESHPHAYFTTIGVTRRMQVFFETKIQNLVNWNSFLLTKIGKIL
jgi:hypothetical protein